MSPVGLIVPLAACNLWEIAARLGWLDRNDRLLPPSQFLARLGRYWRQVNLGTSLGHVCARIQRLRFGQPDGPLH